MIRELLARFKCDTRGAAAIEFGIVIVPLLLFMFGIIEFSRAFWAKEALQQTAVDTARCMGLGSRRPPPAAPPPPGKLMR